MICAHLDAWDLGQGAIDNGSSVAILTELARQFKLQNIQTKRRIRFQFFMAEEFGLLGSNHYAQSEIAQLENIFYVINLEMNLAPIGINLMFDDRNRHWFELLTEKLQSLGMQKQVLANPWLESDHTPFMMKGVPVLTFIEKTNIFSSITYHSNQDKIDLIKLEDLENSVKVIGIILQEMANTTEIEKYRMTEEQINQKLKQFGLYNKLRLRKMVNS
jgi:Zn-dependent M28 family amino/carboxypeptidase